MADFTRANAEYRFAKKWALQLVVDEYAEKGSANALTKLDEIQVNHLDTFGTDEICIGFLYVLRLYKRKGIDGVKKALSEL